MAKQTPEGKVKADLLKFLKSLGDKCFYYMPVQNGMGQSGIPDIMVIINGIAFAFECKATPKQHPTALQAMQLERIHKAGGIAWVVDNESIHKAKKFITDLDESLKYGARVALSRTQTNDLAHKPDLTPLYRWRSKLEVMEFNQ